MSFTGSKFIDIIDRIFRLTIEIDYTMYVKNNFTVCHSSQLYKSPTMFKDQASALKLPLDKGLPNMFRFS